MKSLLLAMAVVFSVCLFTSEAEAGRRHRARHSHHHGHAQVYRPVHTYYHAPRRVHYYHAPTYYAPVYPAWGGFYYSGPRVHIGVGW